MDIKILLAATLLATYGCKSAGKLVVKPRDTDVKVNHSTYLNCSTDYASTAIFWFHGKKYVYTGNTILEPYNERFAINRNTLNGTNIYNLVIHSVQPEDAGEYICAEDEGVGEHHSVQLVVLEVDPICRSNKELDKVIGQNTCHIEPDKVVLECSVRYHGNIPPQMEWKKVGEESSTTLQTSTVTSTNQFVSTLNLKGDIAMNNSSFVCETNRTTQTSIKCATEVIKILYAVSGNSTVNNTINAEMHCNANTSQPCSYKWTFLQDNDYTIESSTSILMARKPGWHRCEAECYLRNISCNLLVMKALVYDDTGRPTVAVTATVISVGIILILAVSTAVLYYKERKYKRGFVSSYEAYMNEHLLPMKDQIILPEQEQKRTPFAREEVDLFFNVKKRNDSTLKEGRIVAVAILKKKLFIARFETQTLDAYDLNKSDPDRELLTVRNLFSANDMCACKKNNCLYILNNKKFSANNILKITATGKVIKKWLTKENAVGNLSVTAEGNVILAVHHTNLLLEYSLDGNVVCEMKLPIWNHHLHAIKQDGDHFIVCHGTYPGSPPTVSIARNVENEMVIIKSFGKEHPEEILLRWPCYLAVLTNGCVIVADHLSDQLLLLDSDLKFQKNIVAKCSQRFRGPNIICVEEMEKEALIAVVITRGGPSSEKDVFTQEAESDSLTKNAGLLSSADEDAKDIAADRLKTDEHRKKRNEEVKKIDECAESKDENSDSIDEKNKIDTDCVLLVFDIKTLLQK